MLEAALLGMVVSRPLFAKMPPGMTPKPLDDVLACRSLTDPGLRLACFDHAAATLGTAAEHNEIVVVDRQQVDQARRSLFGFSLPRLPIFGFGGKADSGPSEITASVRSAHRDQEDLWVLILDDGAVWHQTDQTSLRSAPHAGSTAIIRHAALGTFFIRVDGQIGFRAKRSD